MLATAFIFVPLLAFAAMVTYIVAVFAAHYFITLTECTAQGQRTVQWPAEMFTEWLGKPLRLAWLGGLWLLPAIILSGILVKQTGYMSVGLIVTGFAFAMLFPISAVSAFVANSSWTPFHPQAPVLMLKKPGVLMQFYGVVFIITALGIGGFFLAIFSAAIGFAGAIVGSIIAALGVFLYACTLGRLLYVLTYEPPVKRKKQRKATELVPPPEPKAPIKLKRKKLPPLMAPDGPVEAYGMAAESDTMPDEPEESNIPHWERAKPHWDPDRDETPYEAFAPEAVEDRSELLAEVLVKPKESEMKLLGKEPPPPPPDHPFGSDAFAPMGQAETMRNAVLLAIMFGILSGIVRSLFELNPYKGME